ncbi:hypothetical protein FCV25MIE_30114, partial [Fagus crenata]
MTPLPKAAIYISMGQNAGKLGELLHSVANVGPKETASRLLNSMKLTGKDNMDIDEKITAILYNVTSLHELVRRKEGLPPPGTVVLNIHPNNISQKEIEMKLLLDDDKLAKAANYISMGQNAGKLGGVLHSVANVGPKETASRLLNSMKLTGKDDM